MKAHKHAEIIKAKADNMELVVFCKFKGSDWIVARVDWYDSFSFLDEYEYFLCLPKHKEACLHWLNGRDIEARIQGGNSSFVNLTGNPNKEWSGITVFMSSECEIRIKPHKEKRWIGVYGTQATDSVCSTRELCERYVRSSGKYKHYPLEEWQFIEIEVEV